LNSKTLINNGACEGNDPLGRIPSLDGLRGIAILLVLVGHTSVSFPMLVAGPLRFAGNAPLGVNVFFILSGFLIYSLSVREVEKSGAFNWRQFYMRRILRIFPCFYFYILVLLLLMLAGVIALSWQMIVSAATFSLNYRHVWDHSAGAYDYFAIGHYWTLALEEQFYLTWPLLMLLRIRGRLLPTLVGIIALAPFIRIACYFFTPGSREQIGMMFHTGFDSIAAGVLLGELLRRAPSKVWLERWASKRSVVAGALIFLLFLSPLLTGHFRGAYSITIGKSLELFSLCLVITAAVSFPGTLLFRLLNWGPLAYVGVLSYSLYVWNNLFLLGEKYWFNAFPFNIACVVGMALVSHYLVERPFLKLKDRFHIPAGKQAGPVSARTAG
jgi:peptidoglycan/LPS O-acetylase OafA/YrhL